MKSHNSTTLSDLFIVIKDIFIRSSHHFIVMTVIWYIRCLFKKLESSRPMRSVIKKRGIIPLVYHTIELYQPIDGAVSATSVVSADAKSSGKLCAFLSCITSIPRLLCLEHLPCWDNFTVYIYN